MEQKGKCTKHTTAGIRWWSPTQLLICRSEAYVWQSGRDAQFSSVCGRMWQQWLCIVLWILNKCAPFCFFRRKEQRDRLLWRLSSPAMLETSSFFRSFVKWRAALHNVSESFIGRPIEFINKWSFLADFMRPVLRTGTTSILRERLES